MLLCSPMNPVRRNTECHATVTAARHSTYWINTPSLNLSCTMRAAERTRSCSLHRCLRRCVGRKTRSRRLGGCWQLATAWGGSASALPSALPLAEVRRALHPLGPVCLALVKTTCAGLVRSMCCLAGRRFVDWARIVCLDGHRGEGRDASYSGGHANRTGPIGNGLLDTA